MVDWFLNLSPVWQAFLATCFTWFLTTVGASAVFFIKTVSRKLLDGMLGFAAGVMIFVVVEELIPESQLGRNTDNATMGAMLGFAVMMTRDVALG